MNVCVCGGGGLCWSLFWYTLLYVFSSLAIILTRKRELVALLLLSYALLILMFCGSSSRCRGLVCSVCYFLIILIYFLTQRHLHGQIQKIPSVGPGAVVLSHQRITEGCTNFPQKAIGPGLTVSRGGPYQYF